MVRHRKIPVRKHHGVRDPIKQQEDKLKKVKNSINNPPEKGGGQKESQKFAKFKKLLEATKAGRKIKKPTCGREDVPKTVATNKIQSTQATNKIRHIKQLPDESDEDYLRRVNRMTTASLKEAQYEAKYGVQVIRDPRTGTIIVKKKPKNEIDELIKQKEKERRAKKSKKKISSTKTTTKLDPKVLKDLIKEAAKSDSSDTKPIEEYKRDVIKFGEIVHGPPTLSALPRKAQKSETVPRPGKKNNLLLKNIIAANEGKDNNDNAPIGKPIVAKAKVAKVTKSKLQGKRKDLPAATRSMLEKEQSKFVELYRNLKKAKTK